MAEIILTKENFEEEALRSAQPVLVDFWASWCGPCRMLAPIVAEIAEEYDGRVRVGKVNVDEQPELAAAFRVDSIPTVAVIRDGKLANLAVGYRPKDELIALLGSVE